MKKVRGLPRNLRLQESENKNRVVRQGKAFVKRRMIVGENSGRIIQISSTIIDYHAPFDGLAQVRARVPATERPEGNSSLAH